MTYLCGPSILRLIGHAEPVLPETTFDHDFSAEGPEGFDGPSREAALIAAGAIVLVPDLAPPVTEKKE